MEVLRASQRLLCPGGWIAVKVPCGRNQFLKEAIRGVAKSQPIQVSQLGHVNQFSVGSLRTALDGAGFVDIEVRIGCPELFEGSSLARRAARVFRSAVYSVGSALPGGVHTPLALNLQAYARRP
jgi:hypothetical protein